MISREKLQFIMMVMKNTNSIKATAVGIHRNTVSKYTKGMSIQEHSGKRDHSGQETAIKKEHWEEVKEFLKKSPELERIFPFFKNAFFPAPTDCRYIKAGFR